MSKTTIKNLLIFSLLSLIHLTCQAEKVEKTIIVSVSVKYDCQKDGQDPRAKKFCDLETKPKSYVDGIYQVSEY